MITRSGVITRLMRLVRLMRFIKWWEGGPVEEKGGRMSGKMRGGRRVRFVCDDFFLFHSFSFLPFFDVDG